MPEAARAPIYIATSSLQCIALLKWSEGYSFPFMSTAF